MKSLKSKENIKFINNYFVNALMNAKEYACLFDYTYNKKCRIRQIYNAILLLKESK